MMAQSRNYQSYRTKLLSSISLGLLVRMAQYLNTVKAEDAQTLRAEVCHVLGPFKTHRSCPHCGATLYLSDLPQYDYVCHDCDENF